MPSLVLMKTLGKRAACLLLAGSLCCTGCAGRSDKGEVTPLTVKEEERFCLEFRGEHLEEEKFRAILDQELRDNDLPGLVSCRPDTVAIRVKEKELFNVDSIPLSGNTLLRHYEVAKWFMELDLPDLRGGFGSGSLSGGGSRSSGGGGLEDSVLETPLKAAFAVALAIPFGTIFMVADFFPQSTLSLRAGVSIGRGEAPEEQKIIIHSGRPFWENPVDICYEKLAERICEALETEPAPAS